MDVALAISCLTISNLPWFMDLTFHITMQYCSLQHWTLLPPPDTSTIGCCFWIISISSYLLQLFLWSSLVVYLTPTNLESSSFSVISFCLFILFLGFSRQVTVQLYLLQTSPLLHVLLISCSSLACSFTLFSFMILLYYVLFKKSFRTPKVFCTI